MSWDLQRRACESHMRSCPCRRICGRSRHAAGRLHAPMVSNRSMCACALHDPCTMQCDGKTPLRRGTPGRSGRKGPRHGSIAWCGSFVVGLYLGDGSVGSAARCPICVCMHASTLRTGQICTWCGDVHAGTRDEIEDRCHGESRSEKTEVLEENGPQADPSPSRSECSQRRDRRLARMVSVWGFPTASSGWPYRHTSIVELANVSDECDIGSSAVDLRTLCLPGQDPQSSSGSCVT